MDVQGWLTPSREFVACERWCHVSSMVEKLGLDWLREAARKIEEIGRDCDELADSGEHPEWHHYEMAEDDTRSEAYVRLIGEGYVRVGSRARTIHFEGKQSILNEQRQALIDFAESYGADYEFEPRK